MLIPSIDLQGGRIVQLVQGERLAVETNDVDGWIARLSRSRAVQLIDLDAAKAQGDNLALVDRICRALPCRVGGGVRSIARAHSLFDAGARQVILGSTLFRPDGPDLDAAAAFEAAFGIERLIAALDARQGRVVVHGWRTALSFGPEDAIQQLEPFVGEFLYTHVDREGLMGGTDRAVVERLRGLTMRRLTAAGGITTWDEIRWLDDHAIDAVVGMALYTGRLALEDPDGPETP